MTALTLTAGERSVLRAIDEAPEKRAPWSALPKKSDLTPRGFAIVATRMIRRSLIARNGSDLTITFAGMRALKNVE